jgi:CRP-like cAMP-binding protein
MLNQSLIFNNLKASIESIFALSEENWEILSTCLVVVKLKKNSFLLQAGELCDSIFFIHNGYCRSFHINDGNEVNINFHFENELITNIKSYTKKVGSEYSIQACENMVVVKINKNELIKRVYKNTQEFEIFGRKMLEFMIMKQDEHLNLFKLYTPQQRYEYIEKNRPEIIRRIPLTQIASYLGVTRETLTRIRKKKMIKI